MTSSKIYSSIHKAAANGSAPGIDEWLTDDPSLLNSVDQSGWTPLHTAAFYQKDVSTAFLLQKGAATHAKNRDDKTPLELCMKQGYSESFRLLCDAEKQCYLETGHMPIDSKGDTIVHMAARCQDPLVLKEMLSFCNPNQKNDLGSTVLSIAAYHNHHEAIALLLSYPHFATPLSQANKDLAVHVAVSRAQIETSTLLLDHQANVQTCDDNGWSLLHLAVQLEDFKLTELLMSHGADVNFQHSTQVTALHIAAKHQGPAILDLLLSHGAQASPKTDQGVTPLHVAATHLREKAVRSLVQAGADLQVQNIYGQTPLHNAASQRAKNALSVVQYLVESGASIMTTDIYGKTPLKAAQPQGDTLVCRYLEEVRFINYEKAALGSAIAASMASSDSRASSSSLSPLRPMDVVTNSASEGLSASDSLKTPAKDLLITSPSASPPVTTRRL